ncbi:unnamed protein product [Polarella glacialis]|uniref:Calcineurin-like phosphoesterase domain-containing protein n=1 Tax=Polarella glacialis TaxID=89957 RepID=A0A813LKQ2_POLGL|nr:unnamed protein product [Polarella glacialis]
MHRAFRLQLGVLLAAAAAAASVSGQDSCAFGAHGLVGAGCKAVDELGLLQRPSALALESHELSGECTSLNANPFADGAVAPCCAGSEKCLKDWDADHNFYYKCLTSCSATETETKPTETKPTCTSLNANPFADGAVAPCCAGSEKCLKDWDADHNLYYKCLTSCSATETKPTETKPTCTSLNANPFVKGAEIPCCAGSEKCLGEWNADNNYYYKCAVECSVDAYHPHFNTEPDYLDIASRARGVKGNAGQLADNYYLVVGDQGGCSGGCDSCCLMQRKVAAKMKEYVLNRRRQNPSSTLLFVLAVGDNFYWMGAKAGRFKATWADVYGEELTSVPWFAVMGNHDYGNDDPEVACPNVVPRFTCDETNLDSPACGAPKPYSTESQHYAGNQLNADKGGVDGELRRNFHMPDFTFYYRVPELDFELIAMDTNWYDRDGSGGNGYGNNGGGARELRKVCGSTDKVISYLRHVLDASDLILRERASAAESRNVAIISHYPDEFMQGRNLRKDFVKAMPADKQGGVRAYNFFGHTHVQECRGYDGSGCVDFLTGGSGGCCSTNDVPAGFVAIAWNNVGLQEVECMANYGTNPAACSVWNFYSLAQTGASRNGTLASERGVPADVCEHTDDEPSCPNYWAPGHRKR